MSDGRNLPKAQLARRVVLAIVIGAAAGALLNAALGEKGADTPALAIVGGAAALGVTLLWARRRPAE